MLVVNATAVLTLPISIIAFMRQSQYYKSPLFVAGVTIAVLVSLLMIVAVSLSVEGGRFEKELMLLRVNFVLHREH